MAELRLPEGPAELFEAVCETIGHHLGGEDRMLLGGGTALAMRWAHRHSTDVDLFTSREAFGRLFANRESFEAEIRRRTDQAVNIHVQDEFARILLGDDGEVSLSSTRPRTPDPRSDDLVHGTEVSLETNAEIIAKKVRYRMLRNATLVPRDLYDIAVSPRYDSGAFEKAVANIDTAQLEDLRDELRYLPRDWMRRHDQQLIRPVHPEEALRAVAIFRRRLADAVDDRKPPRYRPPGAWER